MVYVNKSSVLLLESWWPVIAGKYNADFLIPAPHILPLNGIIALLFLTIHSVRLILDLSFMAI